MELGSGTGLEVEGNSDLDTGTTELAGAKEIHINRSKRKS